MQKLVMFDLQVSPQYISEEDNETESENKILCTPQPKRLRKRGTCKLRNETK